MNSILYSFAVLGSLGLLFGLLLAFASGIFKVETDERVEEITALLPGANCGGCGYPGCSALAAAIADGTAAIDTCSVAKKEQIDKIAKIMNVDAGTQSLKKVAVVLCSGTCDKISRKYEYDGIRDCRALTRLGGGEKDCISGCAGYGTCVSHCRFDAIAIKDGVAEVDREKCVGCGVCVAVCPKKVIALVPKKETKAVLCNNRDKGAAVRTYCATGCIGCGICKKTCEHDAIALENNLAVIDAEKCTNCGACAEKCPRKVIHQIG